MKKLLSALLMLVSITTLAQNKTYYINANTVANGGGNDLNSGLSPALAWSSISKANTMNFQAGDKILLFSDGNWNNGSFAFDASDTGTPANPIIISKYGPNPRTNVWAGSIQGVFAGETASIVIKNINFYGARTQSNTGSNTSNGINFYMGASASYKQLITIDSCRIEGFGEQGILIQAYNAIDANQKGFSDITITNTVIKNCGKAGINIGGFGGDETKGELNFGHAYMHNNILIKNVRAINNHGTDEFTDYATGNGILVSSASNATIENCVADYNGFLNSKTGVGIAGIWFYNVNGGLIQNCESAGNYAGKDTDGNGFGIDGGCQNCTIQYCYSHDNEGAGYGLFEYGSKNPHTNNTIRYNISQNDGRNNKFGAFIVWGVDATHKVTNDNVYGNSFYLSKAGLVDPLKLPAGIKVLGNNIQNVKFMNNAFYMADNLDFTRGVSLTNQPFNILPAELLMQNNMYYNAGGSSKFSWGSSYNTLADWRTATSQEKTGGTDFGFEGDPGFTSPGTGGTIAGAIQDAFLAQGVNHVIPNNGDLKTLTQYQLTANAAAKTKGLNLATIYSINIGTKDYYGLPLAGLTAFDIGAHQASTVMPLASLSSFSATVETTGNKLVWVMNNLYNANKFEVEASTDGLTFTKVGNTVNANGSLQYTIFDALVSNTTYYRLKGIDSDGLIWNSKVVIADRTAKQELLVYPNPVIDVVNIALNWNVKENVKVVLINSAGKVALSKNIVLNKGNNSVSLNSLNTLATGIYILKVSGGQNSLSKSIVKQ